MSARTCLKILLLGSALLGGIPALAQQAAPAPENPLDAGPCKPACNSDQASGGGLTRPSQQRGRTTPMVSSS